MSLRSKAATAVVIGAIAVVGFTTLQSPSNELDRIKGTDRINRGADQGGVLLTVQFTPDRDLAGPLAVAVTWHSATGPLDWSVIDEGNGVASRSPYTHTIRVVKGAKVTAAAVPAKRDKHYRPFWTTECWLHQNGALLPGPKSHDGPNPGGDGCRVSGVAVAG